MTDDSDTKIHWCPFLCADAVYAQRKHDLFNIGTKLRVRSLHNLLFKENIDIEELTSKLTAKLQMYVFLNRPQEIYFQHNLILNSIFSALQKKMDIDCFSFGSSSNDDALNILTDATCLTDEEHVDKTKLLEFMVGLPHYKIEYSKKEYTLKVGG